MSFLLDQIQEKARHESLRSRHGLVVDRNLNKPEQTEHQKLPADQPVQNEDWLKGEPKGKSHKTCLIDVGGGARGIYAAGVQDRLLDEGICVDLCIGVSAGSANLANFIARQKGRTYAFYHDFAYRKEYASFQNMLRKHSYFDMDYIYSTLSNADGEYPLDYEKIKESSTELIVVATNALTGRPAYLDKHRIGQDQYALFKGSCSVPYLCTASTIAGIPFCDGTVSDPVPVQKALDLGADRIVVILPRDPEMEKPSRIMDASMDFLSHASAYGKAYPQVARALKNRVAINNASFDLARKLERQGKLIFVSAHDPRKVRALYGSKEEVRRLYLEGYADGKRAAEFLKEAADS